MNRKKNIYKIAFTFITVISIFYEFTACSSIPKYSEYFLQNEGAPLSLEDSPASNNINGDFPDAIYIKTQTQTFSFDYEYLIKDGHIYYKKRGTDKSSWELMLGTGLPFSKNNKFPSARRVVEIAADADVLYAFSSKGQLYRCYTKQITSYAPFEWVDYFGWPIKLPLYQNESVKNKKAWAVGSSRLDVEYYEDIYGNQHNYGPLGVETIPFLSEDGQTIYYSDPACPSDFSHTFRVPDNVVLENISESASTFFAITKDGKMFTRLVDFNTVGSDPMLYEYSYEEIHSEISGSDKKSNTTIWALPNEPWKIEADLPEGARATTYVTIIQTGKGNSSRELRVAAVSPQGQTGFYYKNIDDDSWNFMEAPLTLPEKSFTTQNSSEATDKFQKYSGGLWVNGNKIDNIKCQIEDFHFSEGPCTLNINDEFSVQFYYSEVWTLFLRLKPGFEDESIRYFGTAIFDEKKLSQNPINPVIKKIFENRNKKIHDFLIEAFDSYLRISLEADNNLYEFYMTKSGEITVNPHIDISVIQKTDILENRLKKQRSFYWENEDLYKAEKKISKNKKKYTRNLRAAIGTKKGKKHPIIEVTSKKNAIILQYSGEICRINKNYYKENYKLERKYIKAIISYEDALDSNPDFNFSKVFEDYISNNPRFAENEDLIFIDDVPYYPCFIIATKNGYELYSAKKSAAGIIKFYNGNKNNIKLKKQKFKY